MGKSDKEKDDMVKEVEMDDHKIPIEEVVARYSTHLETGLTDDKVAEVCQIWQQNLIPKKT